MSGIFGVISDKPCIRDLFYGTDYNSHMGSVCAGIAVLGQKPVIHNLDSQFKSRFKEVLSQFPNATSGIGVISSNYPQPLEAFSGFGQFAICKSGRISNLDEIIQMLLEKGWSFTDLVNDGERRKPNPVAVAGKIIAEQDGVINGIDTLASLVEGSLSILLLHEKGIYAARTKHGHNPLFIGKKRDENTWAVTGETCAFKNLGYKIVKELAPGEIVLITKNGIVPKKENPKTNKICPFLWVYTGYPASTYHGINVEVARYQSGKALALRDSIEGLKADMVAGVPESGTAHAIGYSHSSGLKFMRPLVKYADGYGRSYTPTTQQERDAIAQMKLIAIPEIAEGKSIVIIDDSIVRGTQLRNFTIKKLWEAGAREIHLRIACPPLMWPCKYGNSTKTFGELAARQIILSEEGSLEPSNMADYLDENSQKHVDMIERIRKDIGVTSLKFQKIDDMMAILNLDKGQGCTYCWNGKE